MRAVTKRASPGVPSQLIPVSIIPIFIRREFRIPVCQSKMRANISPTATAVVIFGRKKATWKNFLNLVYLLYIRLESRRAAMRDAGIYISISRAVFPTDFQKYLSSVNSLM